MRTIRCWSGPPRIPISRLTLEFDSGQIVLRMNGRSPFLSINAFG